jgi:hypothetical protein
MQHPYGMWMRRMTGPLPVLRFNFKEVNELFASVDPAGNDEVQHKRTRSPRRYFRDNFRGHQLHLIRVH